MSRRPPRAHRRRRFPRDGPQPFGIVARAMTMRRLSLSLALVAMTAAAATAAPVDTKLPLAAGWTLQSSAKVTETGEVLSTTGYRPTGWYPVTVPTTVVAALVKLKVYPDPYFGMN